MDTIFQVIDIWLNVIPYVDYRTFQSIKRLNKAIYRDCYIKKRPMYYDFKNWSFELNPKIKEKSDSEWKIVKYKVNNINALINYLKQIEEIDYDKLVHFIAFNIPYGFHNYRLQHCLSLLIAGDTLDLYINLGYKKYSRKFYYDGQKFILMNYTTEYIPDEYRDYEIDYLNTYVYPEHILQFVKFDIKQFLENTKCLVYINKISDYKDYIKVYNPFNDERFLIGLHKSFLQKYPHLLYTNVSVEYKGKDCYWVRNLKIDYNI